MNLNITNWIWTHSLAVRRSWWCLWWTFVPDPPTKTVTHRSLRCGCSWGDERGMLYQCFHLWHLNSFPGTSHQLYSKNWCHMFCFVQHFLQLHKTNKCLLSLWTFIVLSSTIDVECKWCANELRPLKRKRYW